MTRAQCSRPVGGWHYIGPWTLHGVWWVRRWRWDGEPRHVPPRFDAVQVGRTQ